MIVAAHHQQGGAASFGDECRTSQPVHDPALRNPRSLIRDPQHRGRDDLVELALCLGLLFGACSYRLTGNCGFPAWHGHRPEAPDGPQLPTGTPNVP